MYICLIIDELTQPKKKKKNLSKHDKTTFPMIEAIMSNLIRKYISKASKSAEGERNFI